MSTRLAAYSAESEELKLDLKDKDSEQNGSSNMTGTPRLSSESSSPTPRFMEILRKLIFEQFQKSTSSQEDSPAKTSAMLESELASRGVEVHSGNITVKRLGYYNQDTQSLRTSQHSLVEDSMLCLQALPKSGMMRNGIIYQLPQLVRCTGVKGSSSSLTQPTMWHTPSASEQSPNWDYRKKGGGKRKIPVPNLYAQVKMFPTPISGDWKGQVCSNGKERMLSGVIEKQSKTQMFPTPNAFDWNVPENKSAWEKRAEYQKQKGVNLHLPLKSLVVHQATETGKGEKWQQTGQLNPMWVEWLMGFPLGWTELNASETQSFRRSQKSSHKQSTIMKPKHDDN